MRWGRSISSPRRSARRRWRWSRTASPSRSRPTPPPQGRRCAVPGGVGDDAAHRGGAPIASPIPAFMAPARPTSTRSRTSSSTARRGTAIRSLGGHERGRRSQELGPQHEKRHRHARGAVRHPAAQGRAVSRAGHPHLPRGSRGLGEEGRRQRSAPATRCCCAGDAGRGAPSSGRGRSTRARPGSTTR